MTLKPLKIKIESYYFWDDMVYLNDFNQELIKVVKRESRIDADIYYIGYKVSKPQYNINNVNPLYLIVKNVVGRVEKIKGSSDRYLVVDESNKKIINVFDKLWSFVKSKIDKKDSDGDGDKIVFGKVDGKITGYNKLRFSSDVDYPSDTLIEFHSLVVVINCVIRKGNKLYPEVYLDEGIFEIDTVYI